MYLGVSKSIPEIRGANVKILRAVYFLGKIIHMHPHKPALRALSGYIWELSSITEAAILKYEGSLLPRTDSSHADPAWAQLCHRILAISLMRLLDGMLQAGQKS